MKLKKKTNRPIIKIKISYALELELKFDRALTTELIDSCSN